MFNPALSLVAFGKFIIYTEVLKRVSDSFVLKVLTEGLKCLALKHANCRFELLECWKLGILCSGCWMLCDHR